MPGPNGTPGSAFPVFGKMAARAVYGRRGLRPRAREARGKRNGSLGVGSPLLHAILPVPWALTPVSYSNNLGTSRRLPKDDNVRKPSQNRAAGSEVMLGELAGGTANSFHRVVKLVEEPCGSTRTPLPVPIDGGLRLIQSGRVDPNGRQVYRSNRACRRRRASSHGMSRTAPLSICCRRR